MSNGITPLFMAAEHGHTSVVEMLIRKHNANVELAHLTTGATPLYVASERCVYR